MMEKLDPRTRRKIVVHESGCWLWATPNSLGYGKHRTVYQRLVGPIPEGLELDHLCRVKACVNPEHLEPVTHITNIRRGFGVPENTCRRGHPVVDYQTAKCVRRRCRECAREAERRYRTRKKAAA